MKSLKKLPVVVQAEYSTTVAQFVDELKKTHNKEQDPFGTPWSEPEEPKVNPILKKSGRLYKSYKALTDKKNGTTVLKNTAKYAGIHQKGSGNIAQRTLLPEFKGSSAFLPKVWEKILIKNLNRTIMQKLNKA